MNRVSRTLVALVSAAFLGLPSASALKVSAVAPLKGDVSAPLSYAKRKRLLLGNRHQFGGTPFKTTGNRAQRARQMAGFLSMKAYAR